MPKYKTGSWISQIFFYSVTFFFAYQWVIWKPIPNDETSETIRKENALYFSKRIHDGPPGYLDYPSGSIFAATCHLQYADVPMTFFF